MSAKELLKPAATLLMRKLGYKGSYPHFRKIIEPRIQLITFQIDKYGGPKFVVEVAASPRGDFKTYWGKIIPESKLSAWDLHPYQRLRLGSTGTDEDFWFDIDSKLAVTMTKVETLLKEQAEVHFIKCVPP